MRELSLFSGAGGGLLGTHLLGWTQIGYVEIDDYCQQVIAQRIADGILPVAPIFGDVRQFVESGAAAEYRGFVDVVTGGFPCQPFSVAGKQLGADDPRNMWPATAECVRIIRPRFCLFENVPGLLNSGYFGRIVADLAACGYVVRWRCLSAAELGAPHRRDRLWIVAHAARGRTQPTQQPGQWREPVGSRQDVADAERERWDGRQDAIPGGISQKRGWNGAQGADQSQLCGQNMGHTASARLSNRRGAQMGESQTQSQLKRPSWWESESGLGRLAHGIPNRVDRLKATGNGQVPAVVAAAWRLLTEGLEL